MINFVLLILIIKFLAVNSSEIVFVHIGSNFQFQSHIWISARQARLFNPNANITLILEETAINTNYKQRALELRLQIVYISQLREYSKLLRDFEDSYFLHGDMRPNGNRNFAKATLERLFLIGSYMQKTSSKHLFHLENDNLLYADLQKTLLPSLLKCKVGVAYPLLSSRGGGQAAFSLTYFKDYKSASNLLFWILKEFQKGKQHAKTVYKAFMNDMKLGYRYMKEKLKASDRKNIVQPLPFKETYSQNELNRNCVLKESSNSYIVDAATIGQYFGGDFHTKLPGYTDKLHFYKIQGRELKWKQIRLTSGELVRVPFINNLLVINIHVHTKQFYQFLAVGE